MSTASGAAPLHRRARALAFLELERPDLIVLGLLLVTAFVFRFFSPLMPDFFTHPFDGPPISDCVQSTPIDPQGHLGTLCGLNYPFQKGSGQPLQPPAGQIFDEIYFAVFAHNDLTGISYFDPEPPLSKEIMAAGEWGWGWFRATFQGARGSYADLGFTPFGWRIMSCLVGTLCVPMMYLLAHRLWSNRLFATAAGVLTCFDGMFFVQSRIGMIDIFPIFLILLSYFLFLLHWRSRTARESLVTLLLTGIAIGLAISAKWISLAALATMLFFLFMRFVRPWVGSLVGADAEQTDPERSRGWRWGAGEQTSVAGGVRWPVYLGAVIICLALVPVGIYLASWFPFFQRGQFKSLADLVAYQHQIFDYHAHLTATHPYGSAWFSWPFLYRPVAYYFEGAPGVNLGLDDYSGRPLVAGMIDLGNPWIWWSSIPCLLVLPYFIFKHRSFAASVIAVGFVTQFLPWARITRVIFLYHMFGGLIFMILALAFVLAQISLIPRLQLRLGRLRVSLSGRDLLVAHLVVAVLAFLYFYPVWTALPISDHAYLGYPAGEGGFPPAKMWFRSWI